MPGNLEVFEVVEQVQIGPPSIAAGTAVIVVKALFYTTSGNRRLTVKVIIYLFLFTALSSVQAVLGRFENLFLPVLW